MQKLKIQNPFHTMQHLTNIGSSKPNYWQNPVFQFCKHPLPRYFSFIFCSMARWLALMKELISVEQFLIVGSFLLRGQLIRWPLISSSFSSLASYHNDTSCRKHPFPSHEFWFDNLIFIHAPRLVYHQELLQLLQ